MDRAAIVQPNRPPTLSNGRRWWILASRLSLRPQMIIDNRGRRWDLAERSFESESAIYRERVSALVNGSRAAIVPTTRYQREKNLPRVQHRPDPHSSLEVFLQDYRLKSGVAEPSRSSQQSLRMRAL